MIENIINNAKEALMQINEHLEEGITKFWLKNGIDKKYGGYLTSFNDKGLHTGDFDKYIVTQTRMIWGLSALYKAYPEKVALFEAAKQGVEFFIKNFWDKEYGGWFWKVKRDGSVIDSGKVVYGNSFAIYALAEYSIATGDMIGLEYAEKTFDLLQKYCTDTYNGGYYENLETDWSPSEPEYSAGDRKSLDVHMHLMEAFTALLQCSGKEIHKRKLQEIIQTIINKMMNITIGYGLNQFDLQFKSIPPINIRRTWNAERISGETIEGAVYTTSYGHNVELVWLLNRAGEVLKQEPCLYNEITSKFVDHAIKYGLDKESGGIYRDGPYEGEALVKDKEWWQNCEVMVGFLDAFEKLGDLKYFEAFYITWNFSNKYFIDHELGEWRQLLDIKGNVIAGDIGNPWKAVYHSGRAMLECKFRLEGIIKAIEDK